MNRKPTIALFYFGVALVCFAILVIVSYLRPGLTSTYAPPP
jgi:hypothetical protein